MPERPCSTFRRASRAPLLCALTVALAACSRPSPDAHPPIAPDPATPKPAPAPAPTASVVPSSPKQGCSTDTDCAWDDPCVPTACMPATGAPFVGCDESTKPPGTCGCVLGACTLRRADPKTGAAKTGCSSSAQCAFEPKTGSCSAGSGPNHVDEGGFCTCDSGTCTPGFVDRTPCKTSAECSWLDDPLRPVPASKVPRPAGKPCSGYARSAECRDGACVTTVWKC